MLIRGERYPSLADGKETGSVCERYPKTNLGDRLPNLGDNDCHISAIVCRLRVDCLLDAES